MKVVYGPGTFINTAAERISQGDPRREPGRAAAVQRAENAARKLAKAKGYSKAEQDRLAGAAASLALRPVHPAGAAARVQYGLTTAPSIDNTEFVSQLCVRPDARA